MASFWHLEGTIEHRWVPINIKFWDTQNVDIIHSKQSSIAKVMIVWSLELAPNFLDVYLTKLNDSKAWNLHFRMKQGSTQKFSQKFLP